jgi:hypothetical protein
VTLGIYCYHYDNSFIDSVFVTISSFDLVYMHVHVHVHVHVVVYFVIELKDEHFAK